MAGESGEFLLEVGDGGGDRCRAEGRLVGGQFGFLGWAEDAGVEEPLVGGAGPVVARQTMWQG